MTVRRIVPDLHVQEPMVGAAFSADVLGLEPVMDLGWVATFAAPGNPAAQLTVIANDATGPRIPDVSIEVDDVDAAHGAAVRHGAEIVPADRRAVGRVAVLRPRPQRSRPEPPLSPMSAGRRR